ncbi:MAG: hypothetical protein OXC68_09845 [Aestuariivita sp.]|nr:hypothetical protein [Aestuariivita sp.]
MSDDLREFSTGGYTWLVIDSPDDYNRLTEILDDPFEPEAIARKLKNNISEEISGVLIEHDYIDKDYRSTFYNFYAKMGRPYRQDCVRLHFFDKDVRFSDSPLDLKSPDDRLEDHYFGYVVLRPTITATLGRSLLSPRARVGAQGVAIQTCHKIHLMGYTLSVQGFPSMAQHVDIAVCAHVACWAILRHYSEQNTQHREFLLHDITMLAKPFDPGGLTPSFGLNLYEAERIFQAAGCYPLMIAREWDTNKNEWVNDDRFFAQLLSYLDSGFPLFVSLQSEAMGNEGHAIVLAGYDWRNDRAKSDEDISHVWSRVNSLLAVDDNLLPYSSVVVMDSMKSNEDIKNYTAEDFDAFIVPLPDKIFYPAQAVETFSRGIMCRILKTMLNLPTEDTLLRRYFLTTVSELRCFSRDHVSQFGDVLTDLLMRLKTTQFLWVIEYATEKQWCAGHIAARVILDASASRKDEQPIWLWHTHDLAFVFDRSSAVPKAQVIQLERPASTPLSRMETNLRSVRF